MKPSIATAIFSTIFIGIVFQSVVVMEVGAIALVASVIYLLVSQQNELFPIGLIALSFAGIQWLVSPILTYHADNNFFTMSVDETTYLTYTIIGYGALWCGVMLIRCRNTDNITLGQAQAYCKRMRQQSLILIAVGGIAMLLPVHASGLLFIRELCSCLFFIGVIMRMYACPKKAILIGGAGLSYLLILSIVIGMFHSLMVWALFIVISIFFLRCYGIKKRLAIMVVLFFCVTTLQTIKGVYRSYTWERSYQGNKVALFIDLYYNALLGNLDNGENKNNDDDINSRFNQGWIISRIYTQIPQYTEYQSGRTVWEAIQATLIPRLFSSNKKDSGKASLRDFEEFTGYHLAKGTSMGLSVWGEAYGNFGLFGGAVFMFVWGMLISGLLRWINLLTRKYGYWIFFTPLIAFNLIKAEINILSVMNWTVKAMVFAFVIIYILRHSYPDRNAQLILQTKA